MIIEGKGTVEWKFTTTTSKSLTIKLFAIMYQYVNPGHSIHSGFSIKPKEYVVNLQWKRIIQLYNLMEYYPL